MNDITQFFGNTSATSNLADALTALKSAKRSTGRAILNFTKLGTWVLGVDNEEVAPGTTIIVNPAGFEAGFIAWLGGQPEGEHMWPINAMPADVGSLLKPVQAEKGWQPQLGLSAMLAGLEISFRSCSNGGVDAIKDLAGEIGLGLRNHPDAFPVVELDRDSYRHKKYGLIYRPIFTVVDWVHADGSPVRAIGKNLV